MKRKTEKVVINLFIIGIIAAGAIWIVSLFVHLGSVEYTNNAQIRQDIVPVNCRVQGYIKKIYFDDFQYVHRGDTLLVIEGAEYQLKEAQAEAALQNALAGKNVQNKSIETVRNGIAVDKASMDEVRVLMENARRDFLRYKNLYDKDAVTKQQYDQMKTNYEALNAKYQTIAHQTEGSSLATHEQTQRLSVSRADIRVAQAALALAQLNLSYTVIKAPCDGFVGRRMIQVGALLQPGQLALSIVSSEKKWIVANFKESQMKHIDLGKEVEIAIDALPDVSLRGKVVAVSDATGGQYSLVPTDNSAGNFVKVEGRIPVKIAFTADEKVMRKTRAGMNVEVEIKY